MSTIECLRSQMELPDAFADFNYSNEIRPGVYDIYAPGGAIKTRNATIAGESEGCNPIPATLVIGWSGLRFKNMSLG